MHKNMRIFTYEQNVSLDVGKSLKCSFRFFRFYLFIFASVCVCKYKNIKSITSSFVVRRCFQNDPCGGPPGGSPHTRCEGK